jgi:hypothetical protein
VAVTVLILPKAYGWEEHRLHEARGLFPEEGGFEDHQLVPLIRHPAV